MNLAAAYEANEVAADNQFSGKRLEIIGFVVSIDKGPLGGVYVRMVGVNEFEPVDALMKPGNEQLAAQLTKMESITVICSRVQRILGSVELSDCDFAPQSREQPPVQSPDEQQQQEVAPVPSLTEQPVAPAPSAAQPIAPATSSGSPASAPAESPAPVTPSPQ